MESEPLSFKYNSCRIDVKVGGLEAKASGFIYRTKPGCDYDYVITAKHTFQEEQEKPNVNKLSELEIRLLVEDDSLRRVSFDINRRDRDILLLDDYDLAIIKIQKPFLPKLKRIVVKHLTELTRKNSLESNSYLEIKRTENTALKFFIKDKERGCIRMEGGNDISNYRGISGSGIYCCEEPALIGVLEGYRLEGYEQNELKVAYVDWDKVNDLLQRKGWTRLNRGIAKHTCITEDRDVIDVREITIGKANLNMEEAVMKLSHDLHDDWFFDSLHYVDMCNTKFVLNYFSCPQHRLSYAPERMEVFYLPKKSFVLRKAMVGTFIDRLVYTAVVNELGSTIDSHLSRFVFSARYNVSCNGNGCMIVNGVEQWTKMNYLIESWVNKSTRGCLVKLDLLNYYDAINKQMLIRLLKEIVVHPNEKACVELLDRLLKGFAADDEVHGIPQNCDASALLATFYVSHIDAFVQTKALHYCRFMDDMYFVAKDVYEARDLLQNIERYLRAIDLSVNAQKVKFVRLNEENEKKELVKELSLYDHKKTMIKTLANSDQKFRRMNAIALLIEQLGFGLESDKKVSEKERDRAWKFAGHTFCSYKLELVSYWGVFYEELSELARGLIDIPEHTPLLCRLIASVRKDRDLEPVIEDIASLVQRKKGCIYEWQAYHLWMLLAFLKYKTPELIRFAAEEIEKNAETKTIEVAAIFIYLVTIQPEYARHLLHMLRDNQLHGNFQKRCALIAMRALDPQVMDEEALGKLCEQLKTCHTFLHEKKNNALVFFHLVSSSPLSTNRSSLFSDCYSGL